MTIYVFTKDTTSANDCNSHSRQTRRDGQNCVGKIAYLPGKKYFNSQVFTPFQQSGNGVILAGSKSVRPYVRTYVTKSTNICTANKRLDIEAHIFAHLCQLKNYTPVPIFFQIVNIIDLHFRSNKSIRVL